MPFLRQSTTQTVRFGPFLDITDGVTEEVSLTLTQSEMRLSKDGGAFAQKSAAGNATHDSDGWYSTALSTTDTDTVGELILNVQQPANSLPVWLRWWVLEEEVYDDVYGASAVGYLKPVTAGRDIDVTATGAAGIDWGNVENPTTALDLSGTDIQLCDTTTALTNDAGITSTAVDNIWNRDATSNQTAGTFGEALGDPAATGESIRELVGEFNAAAAAGDPSTAESIMQYVKQLVNILIGTDGVVTFPAAAAPANAVSLAQVLRAVYDDTNSLDGTKVPQTLNLAASGNIGIDWANVENPTTALDLSGTDIQLVDTATALTNDAGITATAVNLIWDEAMVAVVLNRIRVWIVMGPCTHTSSTVVTCELKSFSATAIGYSYGGGDEPPP